MSAPVSFDIIELKKNLSDGELYSVIDQVMTGIKDLPCESVKAELIQLRTNYGMMIHYFEKGAKDAQRVELYRKIRERLFQILHDLDVENKVKANVTLQAVRKTAGEGDLTTSMDELVALNGKLQTLDEEECQVALLNARNKLFARVLTGHCWDCNTEEKVLQFMALSSLDTVTKQLFLSAVMMSNLLSFDYYRFETLAEVYRTTTDNQLKMRALVGWAFSAYGGEEFYWERQRELALKMCHEEPDVIVDLKELQKQVFFNLTSEKDSREFLKSLEEKVMAKLPKDVKNTDLLHADDVFTKEEQENLFAEFEEHMNLMEGWREKGGDSFSSGFGKMKNFPFFNTLSNWFMPFYSSHPVLKMCRDNDKMKSVVKQMESMTTLCDSDRYSSALALYDFVMVVPNMDVQMLLDALMAGSKNTEERASRSAACRNYLQNLMRYFEMCPMEVVCDPFETKGLGGAFFMSDEVFNIAPLQQAYRECCSVLMKIGDEELPHFIPGLEEDGADNSMLLAIYYSRKEEWSSAEVCLRDVLDEQPDYLPAHKMIAKCYYHLGLFEDALDEFQYVLDRITEENKEIYELGAAQCMLSLRQEAEAVSILYKLDYLMPDSHEVKVTLAWALFLRGDIEKSLAVYRKLDEKKETGCDEEEICDRCLVNLCAGRVTEALSLYKELASKGFEEVCLDKVEEVADVLQNYGVQQEEFFMLKDSLYEETLPEKE